jgi:hypothetical protein
MEDRQDFFQFISVFFPWIGLTERRYLCLMYIH